MTGNNMRGFTIFFAMLVSSLALAIGLAIYDLTVRELDLSSTVLQSENAIYVADMGAECALYWDAHYSGTNSAFATSSASIVPASGVFCNATDIVLIPWVITSVANAATTTFTLTLTAVDRCVTVTVAKVGDPAQTTITSRGHTNCTNGGLQIERALQVTY